AKCQFLFGAAVVLILSAALFVPWQRMEQLTDQLNEKAAAAVARTAVADHVARERARASDGPATEPISPGVSISTTQPAMMIDGQPVVPPRLIGVQALNHPESITRFDELALQRLVKSPRLPFVARTYDNEQGYRYAQPLLASADCLQCHVAP